MQGAINFAVQSAGAKSVHLVLFTEADLAAGRATHEITLDPVANKTGKPQQQQQRTRQLLLHWPVYVATQTQIGTKAIRDVGA